MKPNKYLIKPAIAALCAVILGAGAAGRASAQSFGIHFLGNTTDDVTNAAGVVAITNWNNIASTYTTGTILGSDGVTTATFTTSGGIPGDGGWQSGVNSDGGNGSLMNGYLDLGSNTTPPQSETNVISGLTAAHYDVYIYMYGDTSHPGNGGDLLPNYAINGTEYFAPELGNGTTTYDSTSATIGGPNPDGSFPGFVQATAYTANFSTPPATAAFGNYFRIPFVTPVAGAITVAGEVDTGSWRSPFNGIELVPVTGSAPVSSVPVESPADGAVAPGGTVTLSATVTGSTPITYQWQTDGGSGNAPTNIPGANSTNLVVITTGWNPGTYVYDLVSSNMFGTNVTAPAQVLVVAAYAALPAISVQFVGSGSTLVPSQVAGFVSEEFWNLDNTANGVTYSNVVDGTGTPTDATVTVNFGNGHYHTGDSTTTPDDVLMSGGFWSGDGYTVNVTGVPYSTYDVYVYMLNDNNPNRRYELNLGSQTNWGAVFNGNAYSAPPFTVDTENSELPNGSQMQADLVEFTNVSGSSFTLNGQTPDGNVAMMGIQIYAAFSGPAVAGVISVSPVGSLYTGEPVVLTEYTVSGALPLTYQWQTDGGSGNTPTNIPGATGANLTVNTAAFAAGTYQYQVVVSNGSGSSTSPVQTFTITTSAPVLATDIAASPSPEVYVGEPTSLSASFAGSEPITYQWFLNTGSGPVAIPGATSNILTLSNPQLANAGTYNVTANNSLGGPVSSSTAALTVSPLPTPAPASYAYGAAVLADSPLAYWPLNDTNDPSTGTAPAYDASGHGYYGIYGLYAENGFQGTIVGPEAPQFPGFPSTNGALGCLVGNPDSYVTASAGTLAASNLTYVAWIYPTGPVQASAGILMDRGGPGTGVGFGNSNNVSGMAELGYTWDTNSSATWGWNSLLFPTANQWNFVAMVLTPSGTTLYLIGPTGVVQSTNNVLSQDAEQFGVDWTIGTDTQTGNNGTRTFPGNISSVSVFTTALSSNQIVTLADVGFGITPPPPSVTLKITPSTSPRGSVTLSWSQGTLLQATNVTGPWTTNASTSPYTTAATNAQMFFKVSGQ